MDWKIEVVTIPVSDVDRARDFYAEKVGFTEDIDFWVSDEVHLIQLTPPGSAYSIHLGTPGMGMEPGSISGVFLIVPDVRAARANLAERGVEVGELQVFNEGAYRPAREGDALDNVANLATDRRYTCPLPAWQERPMVIVIVLVESWRRARGEGRLMDENNPVVKACAEGMQAEGEGRPEAARELYERAWVESIDNFEASAAAHYLARQQPSAEETFRWNEEALKHASSAGTAGDERVKVFYPSLYLNMGKSHEDLGDLDAARRCYETAAKKAEDLPTNGYGNLVRRGVEGGLDRIGRREG